LLKTLEADLLQKGFGIVTLNVGRENIDALRLYKRLGYQVVAEEAGKWWYFDHLGKRRDVHEPAWRMEKLLKSD
jgi:ribosomal protein S18 acetylase RimI-like enzyme